MESIDIFIFDELIIDKICMFDYNLNNVFP